MSQLIHIVKIESAAPAGSPFAIVTPEMGCVMNYSASFEEIHQEELVDVSVSDTFEDNQRVYTTTATFTTCEKEPLTLRRRVFRLTAIDGTIWLMGTGERPWPVVSEQNNWPGKPSDSTLKKVTVTWKAPWPMLKIVS